VHVAAGRTTSFLVSDTGALFTWGTGDIAAFGLSLLRFVSGVVVWWCGGVVWCGDAEPVLFPMFRFFTPQAATLAEACERTLGCKSSVRVGC